jgi:hypothetical protein
MENDKFQPFVLDLYTQLGQVQRDIGSLTAGQQAMAEQLRQQEAQMRESESRIIHAMNQFEVRITARIDKVESDLSGRIPSPVFPRAFSLPSQVFPLVSNQPKATCRR